jgi:hypothetical protein
MPGITRLQTKVQATAMEPILTGDSLTYREYTFEGHEWRCGCGLVWDRKHLAAKCAENGHVSRYVQKYYGRGYMENGIFKGEVKS